MEIIANDRYSHRGRIDSPIDAQFVLAWEDLVRTNFPELFNEFTVVLVPESDIPIEKEFELIKGIYEEIGVTKIAIKRYDDTTFYGIDYDPEAPIALKGTIGKMLGIADDLTVSQHLEDSKLPQFYHLDNVL